MNSLEQKILYVAIKSVSATGHYEVSPSGEGKGPWRGGPGTWQRTGSDPEGNRAELTGPESFLCAKPPTKHFSCITSRSLHNNMAMRLTPLHRRDHGEIKWHYPGAQLGNRS